MLGRSVMEVMRRTGRSYGRQAMWEAMRSAEGEFSLREIALASHTDRTAVRSYASALEKAGILGKRLCKVAGRFQEAGYFLVRDVGHEAPRVRRDGTLVPPTIQDCMWRGAKMLRRFTILDLVAAASREGAEVNEEHARDYLRNLVRAGYLAATTSGFVFLASRNTGPRAPMVTRLSTVFDPNLGAVVWHGYPKEDS